MAQAQYAEVFVVHTVINDEQSETEVFTDIEDAQDHVDIMAELPGVRVHINNGYVPVFPFKESERRRPFEPFKWDLNSTRQR